VPVTSRKKINGSENGTPQPAAVDKTRPADYFVGKTVGNCEVIEKINEGGTAFIYKAFNTTFKLNRVLKILKPALTDDEDFHIRFTQEAQLTARLDHSNILRVFNTGEFEGYFFIEMEYIEGKSLRALISEGKKLSEKETLLIASQIVKALDYAHNIKIKAPTGEMINGILHRDIKPENIMLTNEKIVKLMDFGAAKPMNITSNTMQGMIVGTFHYMSPEQLGGRPLDARSDFFSLGIVLYELFTGQKPFHSDKLVSLIEKIKLCRFIPPRKLRPSISPLSEELIEKLLQKKADNRPRSSKEIDEMIQTCIHAYSAWGSGRRIRVPFSFKNFYPTLSLLISCAALALSVYTYMQKPAPAATGTVQSKESSFSLLEKARELETKGLWQEAVSFYEVVPPVEEGGVANEYLEAQVRRAWICFDQLNQFTKARAILEGLRNTFSDPAIDAYLGQIYFKLALYNEARDRLDAAINSKKGSVIQQSPEFKRRLLYFHASSLDNQYIYVNRDPSTLREAIKAWKYYIEFSACSEDEKDKECIAAKKRLEALVKMDEKTSR